MIKKLQIFLLIFAVSFPVQAGQPAYVAGQFYPGDKYELEKQIEKFMDGAPLQMGRPKILIAPHAAYSFSGPIAGRAYQEIRKQEYETVIILGVSHFHDVPGAAIDADGSFETPIGPAAIDGQTAARLLTLTPKIQNRPEAFEKEHSVEVQIPFLQRSLLFFKIVPMLMQRPDLETAKEVGEAIAAVMQENEAAGKRTLLVISTDLSHYPSREDSFISDSAMVKQIEKADPEGLFHESQNLMGRGIPNLSTTMCNEAGVLAGLYAAKALGIKSGKILAQATSAESTGGDISRVVGYAAAAFYENKKEKTAANAKESAKVVLSDEQKKELLKTARKGLEEYLATGKVLGKLNVRDEAFNKPQAVFVTLRKNGELRGCVGTTYPKFPLKQAVIYYAVAAASNDSRFTPVQKDELKDLKIEIAILSPQKKIAGPEAIEPGRDGVVLIQGNKVGLLLPEVWKETGWTKEQFLNELAVQKAGLSIEALKDPSTKFYTFTTETFGE